MTSASGHLGLITLHNLPLLVKSHQRGGGVSVCTSLDLKIKAGIRVLSDHGTTQTALTVAVQAQ